MHDLQVASQALHEERAVLQRHAAQCGSIFHEEANELNNEARLMQAWRTEVNATLQDEVTTMRRVLSKMPKLTQHVVLKCLAQNRRECTNGLMKHELAMLHYPSR